MIAAGHLRSLVERIERLDAEIAALTAAKATALQDLIAAGQAALASLAGRTNAPPSVTFPRSRTDGEAVQGRSASAAGAAGDEGAVIAAQAEEVRHDAAPEGREGATGVAGGTAAPALEPAGSASDDIDLTPPPFLRRGHPECFVSARPAQERAA